MFDPISLITGGFGLLGSIFSADQSAQNTQAQIAASQQQQATQNAFTERMSNTAYQRASADMKSAGLNPMMMFGSGAAASTPSGSSIQAPMPTTQSKWAGIGDAAAKVLNSAIQVKTVDKMTEEIANLQAEQQKIQAETGYRKVQTGLGHQQSDIMKIEELLKRLQVPGAKFSAKQADDLNDINDTARRLSEKAKYHARTGQEVGRAASEVVAPITNSAKAVREHRPVKTQTQESGTDSSGNWYDRFRDTKTWR